MRCPWPALQLGRAIREAEGRGDPVAIAIIADDPHAGGELRAVAQARGWVELPGDEAGDEYRFAAPAAAPG